MSFTHFKTAKTMRVGNPVAKSILLFLADASDQSGYCFPTEKYIADCLELGESTVRKWIGFLADKKFIEKRKGAEDNHKRNGYVLTLDVAEEAPELSQISPLPHSGEIDKQDLSPLPDSNVTATTYHRYDVAVNNNNKDLSQQPGKQPEKESVCAARASTIENFASFDPSTDKFQPKENTEFDEEVNSVLVRLRQQLHCVTLPNETEWVGQIEWAVANGYGNNFVSCYQFLKKQHWRKGRLTPKTVADNLPEFHDLKEKSSTNGAIPDDTNQPAKFIDYRDKRTAEAINDRNAVEAARARFNARRQAALSGRDPTGRE